LLIYNKSSNKIANKNPIILQGKSMEFANNKTGT